jgi:hypothetical protein
MLTEANDKADEWKALHAKAETAYNTQLTALKDAVSEVDKKISDPAVTLSPNAKAGLYRDILTENKVFDESIGTEHTPILAKLQKRITEFQAEDKNQRPTTVFTLDQAISEPRAAKWKEYGKTELVKQAQQALATDPAVAFTGTVDGKWSQQTQDSLIKYQDLKKLPPTGKLDTVTVNALSLGGTVAATEPSKATPSTSKSGSGGSGNRGGSPTSSEPIGLQYMKAAGGIAPYLPRGGPPMPFGR